MHLVVAKDDIGQGQVLVEMAVLQEMRDLRHNQRVVHHEGMGHMQNEMVGHSFEPRALDRDLSVVRSLDIVRINGVEGTVAGDDPKVFHAGTRSENGQVVTSGGRVLCVTALGDDIASAQEACYAAADNISWDGMTLRRDIGWRAIARYS